MRLALIFAFICFLLGLQAGGGGVQVHDAKRLPRGVSRALTERVLHPDGERDNLPLLQNMRSRLDRVGLAPPTITVRFQDLSVSAKVIVGSHSLPSISGPVRARLQGVLRKLGAPAGATRRPHTIVDAASGVLRPGVFTLLLGPPQSGKVSLIRFALVLHSSTNV